MGKCLVTSGQWVLVHAQPALAKGREFRAGYEPLPNPQYIVIRYVKNYGRGTI